MQEIGIDVRSSGYWGSYGVWIEDRPLSEDALKRLVFAISTNPYLSNAEATKILQSLTPLVTAYQESLLQSQVVTSRDDEQSQKLYKIYSVILEAISANKAVRCILAHTQNVRNSGDIQIQKANGILFIPEKVYCTEDKLFVSGHMGTEQKRIIMKLQDIVNIELANKKESVCVNKD